jgi:hypothetical protein
MSGEWIPVAERLPEPNPERMLLVCVECEDGSRAVDVCRFRYRSKLDKEPSWGDITDSNDNVYGWDALCVVAWMPLPEPPEMK